MGDQHRGRGSRQGCDRLSHRRLQDNNDTFYDTPVCPCESEEADPQSEYETSGEWVTYTGYVDVRIFDEAARHAEADVAQRQKEAANAMIAEAQRRYGSSTEATPVLDDESTPVDIDAPGVEDSPELQTPEEEGPEDEENSTQIPQAWGDDMDLPVDPIKDEWAAGVAASVAISAAYSAKLAQEAAEQAQLAAEAARVAKWSNTSQVTEMAEKLTKIAIDKNKFAKRAAEAAKEAAEAAAVTEAQNAKAKLTFQSTHEVTNEYTGDVDVRVFDEAARHAEADVAQRQKEAANVMIAGAQRRYGSSAEATPVLDDEPTPVDIDAPGVEDNPGLQTPEEEGPEDEENNTQIPQAWGGDMDLPVDPIKDEWAAGVAASLAISAAYSAKLAQEAAEEAQLAAEAARVAKLSNTSQLTEMAEKLTKIAIDKNKFAKRAAVAAKEAAEAAAVTEAQNAMAKLSFQSTHEEKKSE